MTFVEFDPLKIAVIQAAILDASRLQSEEINVVFKPSDRRASSASSSAKGLEMQTEALKRQIQKRRDEYERQREQSRRGLHDRPRADPHDGRDDGRSRQPGRVIYRFGALTATSSLPERAIMLNRVVVEQANDELAGETDPDSQRERGQFLGQAS